MFVSLVSLFYLFLSVHLLLQVSADIVGMVEHLCIEIQMQPTLFDTPALGHLPVSLVMSAFL